MPSIIALIRPLKASFLVLEIQASHLVIEFLDGCLHGVASRDIRGIEATGERETEREWL